MAFDLSSLVSLFGPLSPRASARAGVVGIDIGTSSIKIVQVTDIKGVPTLTTYGELQLGPYDGMDVGRQAHLSDEKMVGALKDLIRESRVTSSNTHIALAYTASFNGVIDIPTLDSTQIGNMLPIEARKYVPTALTHVSLDWVRIDQNTEAGSTRVFVSAIYTEALARYNAIVRGANLMPVGHEIELFSSMRAGLRDTSVPTVLLDFGASSTRMAIIHNGMVKKTHSVPLSTVRLTTAIAEHMKTDFVTAEEYKRTYGMGGGDAMKVVTQALDRGLRELHTVLRRFTEKETITAESMFVTGGGALLSGLTAYIQSTWNIPVACVNPFAKVAYPEVLHSTLIDAGPTFAGALGCALKVFEAE